MMGSESAADEPSFFTSKEEIYRNIDYVHIVVIEAGQNAWLFRRLATADLAGISFPETQRSCNSITLHISLFLPLKTVNEQADIALKRK